MAGLVDYVIILGVTAICIYIIYRMIKKIYPGNSSTVPIPYSDTPTSAQQSQLTSIQNTATGSGITNVAIDASKDNSLRNFCIKASYNSAFTGSYVNRDMVKYVLSRGCRFLDFEVFVKDGIPIVAYSASTTDPSYTYFTSLAPAISLSGVFSTIMSNAFTSTSPNPADPLFIQLRIKTYLHSAYSDIAQLTMATLGDKLYPNKITVNTPLNELMGKIVLVIDGQSSPGYQNYSDCSPKDATCYSLKRLANIESGNDLLRIYTCNSLMNQSTNPPDPNVYLMRIVLPNLGFFYGSQNSDSMYLIQNYGAQIVTEAFYTNDALLASYENMFRTYKSAFVPIPLALQYAQGQGQL